MRTRIPTRPPTRLPPTHTATIKTPVHTNTSFAQPTYTLRPPACLGCNWIKAQYKTLNSANQTTQIKPILNIINVTGGTTPLTVITAWYWYTIDGERLQTYYCEYASMGCENAASAFAKMPTPKSDADYYLEISFRSVGLLPGGSAGEIKSRFVKNDWTNYSQIGDYSFDPTKTTLTDWERITIYSNDTLVWGAEP